MLLWALGWIANLLAHPLYVGAGIPWAMVMLNALAGLVAGATLSQVYAWFTTGQADALMTARGGAAGLVAVMSGAPFIPFWAALVIGSVVGLFVPLFVYLVEELLRCKDPAGVLSVSMFGGLVGLLAVALFASGQYGAGWNNVGAEIYQGVTGQGVSGLLIGSGFNADLSQLKAQLLGGGAILAMGLLGGGVILFPARVLLRDWGAARVAHGADQEE